MSIYCGGVVVRKWRVVWEGGCPGGWVYKGTATRNRCLELLKVAVDSNGTRLALLWLSPGIQLFWYAHVMAEDRRCVLEFGEAGLIKPC